MACAEPRTTLNRYLELLSAVFLIKQIPAWSAGQAQRAIGTPKLTWCQERARQERPSAARTWPACATSPSGWARGW
jgi:hypothetical protein